MTRNARAHAHGLDGQDVAAEVGVGQTGNDPDLVLAIHLADVARGDHEEGVDHIPLDELALDLLVEAKHEDQLGYKEWHREEPVNVAVGLVELAERTTSGGDPRVEDADVVVERDQHNSG